VGRRSLGWGLVALAWAVACGTLDASEEGLPHDGGDAGPDALDASVDASDAADATELDAAALCDPQTPFEAPVFVPGLAGGGVDYAASLSPDELRIVFARGTTGVGDAHLYEASRTTPGDAFDTPKKIDGVVVAGVASEQFPTLSRDFGTMYFTQYAVAGYSLARSHRGLDGGFGSPTKTPVPLAVGNASHAHLARHANELWFAAGGGTFDIYRADLLADGGLDVATKFAEIQTPDGELTPVLDETGLVLYWGSNRPDSFAKGSTDIWVATRSSTGDAFTNQRAVPEVNSASIDWPVWLSPDRCRLYLYSYRGNISRLYVASRSIP
jgi:hypothetical protein